MADPVAGAPELFGGKRGGGKARTDGLTPGSEEAKAADRAKDTARKAKARAAAKAASLPAPLPSAAPAASGGAAVAAPELGLETGGGPQPDGAAVAGVGFAAWSAKLLARPWKLVVKIVARLRVAKRREEVEATPLPAEVKAEILKAVDYAEETKAQLAEALANASAVELNKRQVGGAEHSHLLDVGICLADVVNQDLEVSAKITEAVATYLAALEKKAAPATSQPAQAKEN